MSDRALGDRPAYPRAMTFQVGLPADDGAVGVTTRLWLARAAMEGLLAARDWPDEEMVESSFRIADLMLAEAVKPQQAMATPPPVKSAEEFTKATTDLGVGLTSLLGVVQKIHDQGQPPGKNSKL